jgi:hypothetical protein
MRPLFIFIVFLFCIYISTQQELISNIISVSTNQPCLEINANLLNATKDSLTCNTATVIQMGLSPSDSNLSSSTTLFFRAFPQSSGTYNQYFDTIQQTPETLCSNPSSPQCISTIQSENLFTITIAMSPVQVRYQMSPTGLTIPSSYYYHTVPYAINTESPLQACGIDPYSDVSNNDQNNAWNYAKLANSMIINKANLTFPTYDGITYTQDNVFAKYLMSSFSLKVPGDETLPPMVCSDPNTIAECTFNYTSVQAGEKSSQFGSEHYILDALYNRWLNGTLGCGQAFATTDLYTTGVGDNYQISSTQCTQPIGTQNPTKIGNPNEWTTNVCPENPLPNFKARHAQVYPSYCINGPCAGTTEAFCPLVAGFEYGFSRCLLSQPASLEYSLKTLEEIGNTPSCPIATITQPFFDTICDASSGSYDVLEFQQKWYNCIKSIYLRNVPNNFNPNMFQTFEDAVNTNTCGIYLQGITGPRNNPTSSSEYDLDPYCPYPSIFHGASQQDPFLGCIDSLDYYCFNPGPYSSNPASEPTTNTGWTQDLPFNAINDVRQLVIPFQPYTGLGNYQVGFCGSSSVPVGTQPGNGIRRTISPSITTSPCECTAQSGWQDTVVPVGPLCVVYKLTNPGTPTYEIVVDVESNLPGGPSCQMTIGTAVGTEGLTILSDSCNGTVSISDISIDTPRGNVVPSLYGYVVVCGQVDNDEVGEDIFVKDFYGGDDKSGRTNPYNALNTGSVNSKAYRTPLPSTMRDMFSNTGQIPTLNGDTRCTKDSLENCAWWYYVPPAEVKQYGEGCNANGWMNYGVFSTTSTSIMCDNSPGTCVPGYDTRFYDARRFDKNAASNLDGFPYKWPTTKTPLYVARTFVDFETGKVGGTPINLPPGWNPQNPNYWINGDYLFSDSSKTGAPVFPEGSLFVRVELAVAGELLTTSTSFAPGKLCYVPNNLPPNGLVDTCDQDPLTQSPDACTVFVNGGGGTLKAVVYNTGTQVGTYTIYGNCTNGASITPDFDFSVEPNAYSVINLAMSFVNINGENPICTLGLYVGFSPNISLGTLDYSCQMVQNAYDAPGTTVVGTEEVGTSSINNPPFNQATHKNACDGSSPGWWCFKWFHYGFLSSWLFTLLTSLIVIILMLWLAGFISRYFSDRDKEAEVKQINRLHAIKVKQAKIHEVLKAEKEEEGVKQKLDEKERARKAFQDQIMGPSRMSESAAAAGKKRRSSRNK